MRLCKLSERFESAVLLIGALDKVDREITLVLLLHQPHVYRGSTAVDAVHHPDLLLAFFDILLVNTHSINPYRPINADFWP